MNKQETFIVETPDQTTRIDKFLADVFTRQSRSHLQKWINDGCVLVNSKPVKVNHKLKLGDIVIVNEPEPIEVAIEAVNLPLDILYEDKDLLFINKPVDMVVHPAPGHYKDTLVNAVMHHCKDELSGINGELRPGIVHRIDKDTTGVLVICKNDAAHIHVASQLKDHQINRVYEAIVYNSLSEEEGTIDAPIGRHPVQRKKMAINHKSGRHAVTHYKVIERLKNGFTHVELRLETGRTHQIRVHMTSIGHPLLGDPLYGPSKSPYNLPGQMLHAKTLGLIHPRTGQYIEVTAPTPDSFAAVLKRLKT